MTGLSKINADNLPQGLRHLVKNLGNPGASFRQPLPFENNLPQGLKYLIEPKPKEGFLKILCKNKTVAQKMLGFGGIAGMALNLFMPSERGFFGRLFSFGLDALAIASFFNPALLLPVAGLYVARGIASLLNGGTLAGLMDIGVSLLPGLRSMKQLQKIAEMFSNKGFVTAASSFVQSGYGYEAHQQFRFARKLFTSKEAMAKGVEKGFRKTGEYVGNAVKPFREGFRQAAAA